MDVRKYKIQKSIDLCRKTMIFDKQMYWIPILICFVVGMIAEDFRVEDERNGM